MSNNSKGLQAVAAVIFSDARNSRQSFPSFAQAKKLLSSNISYCVKFLNLTETLLAFKINSFYNDPDLIGSNQMHQWISGEKLPNLYILFKMSYYLKVSIDSMLKEDFAQTNRIIFARSFAEQVDSPKIDDVSSEQKAAEQSLVSKQSGVITVSTVDTTSKAMINTSFKSSSKETTMTSNKTNTRTVKISRTRKTAMESVVRERTDSKDFNLLLAYALYNSDMALKTIADKTGISTRSLRDYAFYGTTVPGTIGDKLAKVFNTTVRSLGLYLNNETGRYEHMTVTVA